MDEVFAPEGAIDKAALKALSRRSDLRGLMQLGGHLLLLGVTGAAIAWAGATPWLAPALLLHGVVLIFLFSPLHECIHRTAFESRALNDGLAWACGAVILLPPVYFRAFHFAHHRHTQDPERDPELAQLRADSLGRYLLRVSGLPYWRERGTTLFRHAFTGRVTQPFVTARLAPAAVREARGLLAFYAGIAALSLALGSGAVLLYWVVPALPFHALPAAHELLAKRIETQATGYLAAHRDILAYIRRITA